MGTKFRPLISANSVWKHVQNKKNMTNSIKDRDEEEPSFARPHPLVTLACLGGLGYALPAIAWRPDLLPPPDFAFGLGEFMLFLAEDYRQGGL